MQKIFFTDYKYIIRNLKIEKYFFNIDKIYEKYIDLLEDIIMMSLYKILQITWGD